jgi:DNA invertase Pin-like site-specific DNA recombinase
VPTYFDKLTKGNFGLPSPEHLNESKDDLRARGVKFHSLTEAIDAAAPPGRAMWQMIGVLAEIKRSLISERARAGVKDAMRRASNSDASRK